MSRPRHRWVCVNGGGRFPGASRVLARAPEHVLRNGRTAGQAKLVAEVTAVHTYDCAREMGRWRKRKNDRVYGECRCGAEALFKRWLEEG